MNQTTNKNNLYITNPYITNLSITCLLTKGLLNVTEIANRFFCTDSLRNDSFTSWRVGTDFHEELGPINTFIHLCLGNEKETTLQTMVNHNFVSSFCLK